MKKLIYFLLLLATSFSNAQNQKIDIYGPSGSGNFGDKVFVLPNGNFVVTDPLYDDGSIKDVGAIYLFNGKTLAMISMVKGSTKDDNIGGGGIAKILTNGNIVISSPNWDNGSTIDAGAITLISGTIGLNGTISSTNSLVGSKKNDISSIGTNITSLSNGNYVVGVPYWDNGAITNAGAAVWGNGISGVTGIISSSNSLIGSNANDNIGLQITSLPNGNYLVLSQLWDNGSIINAGAVTWGNGTVGISGIITSSNSLIGSSANDNIGATYYILQNGNYVIISQTWDNGAATDAGAVIWGNATIGVIGTISSSNALIGSSKDDKVGVYTILNNNNGNFLIRSENWDNGSTIDAGAITFCNQATGVTGVISAANSLIGTTAYDKIGYLGIYPLYNGNYVVMSPLWDNGSIVNAGAVTWGNGNTGISGVVSTSNSLFGTSNGDSIGYRVYGLKNGNYVAGSSYWDNGTMVNVGAVTLCDGSIGKIGPLTTLNSLYGTFANDQVSLSGFSELTNGNYLVSSFRCNNGSIQRTGGITWCNGKTGLIGSINSSNTLFGSTQDDQIGNSAPFVLNNGNYLLISSKWDSGSVIDAGAITFGNGTTGISGTISSSNSLIGKSSNDLLNINYYEIDSMHYFLNLRNYDNGIISDAGSLILGNSMTGSSGIISSSNSFIGNKTNVFQNTGLKLLGDGIALLSCPDWDNGALSKAGAIKQINLNTGLIGTTFNATNSLVGTSTSDNIGMSGFLSLPNGNLILRSPLWDNGTKTDVGAITWFKKNSIPTGNISASNSIIGSSTNDKMNTFTVFDKKQQYIGLVITTFDKGDSVDAGAVVIGNTSTGLFGFANDCNSVFGTFAGSGAKINAIYNDTLDYMIINRPLDNIITIFKPNAQTLCRNLDSSGIDITGLNEVAIVNDSCRIIASIKPNGANPVQGIISAKVWIDTTKIDTFLRRHYQITPTLNANNATARLTLYYTQAEFDSFNIVNPKSRLPRKSSDDTGKANLKFVKISGNSINNTGHPSSYLGTTTIIDPNDQDIVFNDQQFRWEVSFDITGFSGFFLKTDKKNQVTSNIENNENKISIYPNPTDGKMHIQTNLISNQTIIVTDLIGSVINRFQLNVNEKVHTIDLSNQTPGIYFIRMENGEVFKVTKQ